MNVDYAADLAMDFEVNAVPTVIAFKNGEPVARFEGDQSDDDLDHFIDGVIESWFWQICVIWIQFGTL